MPVLSRLFGKTFAATLLLGASLGPAFAADYLSNLPDIRGGYGDQWGFSNEPDPLEFEAGIQYWYSMGSHGLTVFGGDYSSSDTSHILELTARIDDHSTQTYVKGNVGYAAITDGTYITPQYATDQTMNGGQVGYATADFGYLPFELGTFQLGGFVGYQYLVDNPDMGGANYGTESGGVESLDNQFETHALRLGISGKGSISDFLDIQAEVAAIPYASLYGTYGALYIPPFFQAPTFYEQGSAGTIEGNLYGGQAEVMLGIHPFDGMTLKLGARGSFLTGDATMTLTAREVGAPKATQNFVGNITNLVFARYGLVAGLTANF
ncbi:MAG: hypothetical protein KDJ19_10500 [Hyphomicrobiaceae bacterium]|nr:hypothetical protein [Hyphomicrobiaceae bacterium]